VHTSIDDLIGEGDKVVLRWTTTATHTGPYGSVSPTGGVVTMTGVDVYRLDGGRIVEAWSVWDALGAYQQPRPRRPRSRPLIPRDPSADAATAAERAPNASTERLLNLEQHTPNGISLRLQP
jgi:hypothetical protein